MQKLVPSPPVATSLFWLSRIALMPALAPLGRATEQPGLVVTFSPAAPVTGVTASLESGSAVGSGAWELWASTTLWVSSAIASAPAAACSWLSVLPAIGVPGWVGLGS